MFTAKMKKGVSLLLTIIMMFTMMPMAIFSLGAEESLPLMKLYNVSSVDDYHAVAYTERFIQ